MQKRHFRWFFLFLILFSGSALWIAAQEEKPRIRVDVQLVQLDVAVTDSKGNYATGLNPSDFTITEDRVAQKIAVFGEGNKTPQRIIAAPQEAALPKTVEPDAAATPSGPAANPDPTVSLDSIGSALTGANVFILFDTSNYMYRGFVYAQDAIANFVRSLDGPDRVAFYAYSRDLSRATVLTDDRVQILRGVRATTAGDYAALYNSLLLTLKDAGTFTGRKAVVVFSNGPDNASMVPPEDVRELAQADGIPIYMISTRDAKIEPVSAAAFTRISASTGGEVYFAKSWQEEEQAFSAIRNDLAHIYSIYYYPQPNPNNGWRAITVKLTGKRMKGYHIRTRSGYRPQPVHVATESASAQ